MNAVIPKSPICIRPAVVGDLASIDGLQKKHSHQVGWMQTKALEGKIEKGEILVAEMGAGQVGYCIGQDRYFKRDDVGIIYQMNIEPGHQRGLIGASLLKAQFERSAWGCRLYCCWCAQDIGANKFWEAMGFVPLAYRAGSEKKARVHIFWQRRIRSGDEVTPYWFPSQTTGGSIREDRLVLPIPPGQHWSEVVGMLPKEETPTPALPRGGRGTGRGGKVGPVKRGARQFGPPPTEEEVARAVVACPERSRGEKPMREKKPKRRNAAEHVAAARELRDRWLERVNGPGGERLFAGTGKYDVSRALAAGGDVKRLAA